MTGDTGPSNDHGAWNSRIVIKMGENKRSVDVGLGQQSVLLSVIKIKSGFFGIGEKRIMMGRGEIPLSEILVNNRVEGKVKISGGEDNTKPFDVEVTKKIYLINVFPHPSSFLPPSFSFLRSPSSLFSPQSSLRSPISDLPLFFLSSLSF